MRTRTHQWNNLTYTLYFTGRDIAALLQEKKTRRDLSRYYERLACEKYYLEFGNANKVLPREQFREIKKALIQEGVRPAGAIITMHRKGPYCYNNPEQMALLRDLATFTAGLFDELIIDDWLFTVCRCPVCVKNRGTKSWAEYRSQLVPRMCARHLIGPAKQVNPKVKIIVKFPNWHEGHHWNGYNVAAQIRQFDEYCVGIETRDQAANPQHLPIYNGYFLPKWIDCAKPGKQGSCWMDNYEMGNRVPEYVAQAYQGVLAGRREIVVWTAGTHFRTNTWMPQVNRKNGSNTWAPTYKALEKELSSLDKLAGLIKAPARGIDFYMPYASEGEYNIFGYLGMIGLPLNPVIKFPMGRGPCILTEHTAKDPQLSKKILQRLQAGGDVLLTGGLFQKLQDSDLRNVLQIQRQGGVVGGRRLEIQGSPGGKRRNFAELKKEMVIPRLLLTTWPNDERIALNRDDGNYIVLSSSSYLNGTLHLLNMPENANDLFLLPALALKTIRDLFIPAIGASLRGESRVALYLYENGVTALYNLNGSRQKVGLFVREPEPGARWKELLHGRKITVTPEDDGTLLGLELGPFEIAVVKQGGFE